MRLLRKVLAIFPADLKANLPDSTPLQLAEETTGHDEKRVMIYWPMTEAAKFLQTGKHLSSTEPTDSKINECSSISHLPVEEVYIEQYNNDFELDRLLCQVSL